MRKEIREMLLLGPSWKRSHKRRTPEQVAAAEAVVAARKQQREAERRARESRKMARLRSNAAKRDRQDLNDCVDIFLRKLAAQEEQARREAQEKAAEQARVRRIAVATVSTERCKHKACPFLAVLDGNCRQHAMDAIAQASTLPSILALAIDQAHIYGFYRAPK